MTDSLGAVFRQAILQERPLQIAGTVNAYCALMAKRAGYRAIYLSGAGVANASYGLPDLGMTSLEDVLIDAKRITAVCDVPLLVDIDTGWGDMAQTIPAMIDAGVAAVHFEDQVPAKRCGHRPNKDLVSSRQMVQRISEAVAARGDPHFFLMARTDALASEGLAATVDRAKAYVKAGADGIFFEAVTELSQYQAIADAIDAPVLANMTEFGQTPLSSVRQLTDHGVAMVLYPLSAFRGMNCAAQKIYEVIRQDGSQQAALELMQDRKTLYDYLDYQRWERAQDQR